MHNGQGDWLPARAALHASGLYFALRDIGPAELHDPFMQETIARVSTAEEFVQILPQDLGRAAPSTAPVGLVFHLARCGSTLVSQLLKQRDGLVVYAEPPPVNEILRPPQPWPRRELVAALRSLGDAFARHARGPYVLKCTSWNTLYCDLIAEAFPGTPWVLCLRDPVEVCVSLLQRPPGWFLGTDEMSRRFAALADPEGRATSNDELVARMYAAFCESALRLDPRRGRLVEYRSLPADVWQGIAPHFGLAVGDAARERMARTATRPAKAPVGAATPFVDDTVAKQSAAGETLRAAIDAHARPALEQLRTAFGRRD
jgi:hypothetical protein